MLMLLVLSVLLEIGIQTQSLMHNIYESKPSKSCSSACLALKLELGPWIEGVPLYSLIC